MLDTATARVPNLVAQLENSDPAELLAQAAERLASNASTARQALEWTGLGVVLLMGVVVVGAVVGISRRISEYH